MAPHETHLPPRRSVVDLDQVDPAVRAWVLQVVADGGVSLTRDGEALGRLEYRAEVLEGTVVAAPVQPGDTHETGEAGSARTDAKVVATTMRLSTRARERLRQSFGPGWVVLDFADAPPTADVVLTFPSSPQLMGQWPLMFPDAQIIITEIEDDELGVDVDGPVRRLLAAGAHGYLPPRPLGQVAQGVRHHLDQQARAALGPGSGPAAFRALGGSDRWTEA